MVSYKNILTRELLIKEYAQNKKSTTTIAKELGCRSKTSISQYLIKFNIRARRRNETKKGKKQTEEHIKNRFLSRKGFRFSTQTKKKMSLTHGGTGIPYENSRYSQEFNYTLRETIRKRDNYICQNKDCNMTEEEHLIVYGKNLELHHIDYNGKNSINTNLITLCKQCNVRAGYNKSYWKRYYKEMINSIYNLTNY